jgi:hypothetical protein
VVSATHSHGRILLFYYFFQAAFQLSLSLVITTEELLDRKVAAPVYKTENTAVGSRHADHLAPSIRKGWQSLRRQAAVARSV